VFYDFYVVFVRGARHSRSFTHLHGDLALSLACRYTRLVAKHPHMMDHLTINISGYVATCVSPMVALILTLLCLRRTTQHHPGVREQQHHRADHAPGLPLGHEPAREPRISRARRERYALRLAGVGDCTCNDNYHLLDCGARVYNCMQLTIFSYARRCCFEMCHT
jgi:hypothetical protein